MFQLYSPWFSQVRRACFWHHWILEHEDGLCVENYGLTQGESGSHVSDDT